MDNLFKQNPLAWWKRRADSYMDSPLSSVDIWGNWRLEEFGDYVRVRPLSKEDVDYFLNFRVWNLTLSSETRRSTIQRAGKSPILFDISLGLPESERNVALIHEVVHGFYRYRGNPCGGPLKYNREERAVEVVAKRFYHNNPEFIEQLTELISLVAIVRG